MRSYNYCDARICRSLGAAVKKHCIHREDARGVICGVSYTSRKNAGKYELPGRTDGGRYITVAGCSLGGPLAGDVISLDDGDFRVMDVSGDSPKIALLAETEEVPADG